MRIAITVLLLGLGLATPTRAAGLTDAERKLEAALICYGKLELDCFGARLKEALDLARQQRAKPELVGRIHLYLGVHNAVLNRHDEAARTFREALRRDPLLDLDPQQFKPALVTLFREVKAKLTGTLAVVADVQGAQVSVDGERVGVAPLKKSLPIGRHTLSVTGSRGQAGHSQDLVIRVDQTLRVRVSLSPPAAKARPATARRPAASPPPARRRVWTWVAAGGAAVTLAVAIGLGASASADHAAWEEELEQGRAGGGDPQTWEALGQDVESKATAANVLFVASGALAVTAAVLFFVEGRGAAERPAVRARTTLGQGPGVPYGLSLTHAF